jgi:ABC-type proline/glycine betaine transport system substrate-binding protein
MAHRTTHLRLLENEDGSILIIDEGWKSGVKMSHYINAAMFQRAENDQREAALMFRQLSQFLTKHRALRQEKTSAKAQKKQDA